MVDLTEIQTKIEEYVIYLEDKAYVDEILKSTETHILLDTVEKMLRSNVPAQIFAADLFIRDIILVMPQEMVQALREGFYSALIVDAINQNVFAPFHFIRHDSVYTIGKIWLKDSIHVLAEAFEHFLESDPILLSGLIFELQWLRDTQLWTRTDQMAHSASYLTRWATLSTIAMTHKITVRDESDNLFADKQMEFLQLLRTDRHPMVRNEAEYKYQQFILPRKEAKKLVPPEIDFDSLEIRFGNYLAQNHKDDYSLDELEAFADSFQSSS